MAILAAVAAGFGEETLFRGTLQPILGLWLATAVFAAIHCVHLVTNGFSLNGLFYLGLVFVAGLMLGILYSRLGLLAAFAAHTSVDAVLLLALRGR